MIFSLQVDISTMKTPINFQTKRSKDSPEAAILMTFWVVSDHYLVLLTHLHDFYNVGALHKKGTYRFSDETVKGHACGGHFSGISGQKRSFPIIISSIYWLICMIFTMQVHLSTWKTPTHIQTGRFDVLVPFTNAVHQWCWALQLPTAFQLLLFPVKYILPTQLH